ncbi:MAG: 2-hydroxyacyl-CoA dehydratase [Deltaproteobacteria bacterium]|nr:2-hydroxyacyl-CoA dehydratase [Deltaproteobacteria bacterium]
MYRVGFTTSIPVEILYAGGRIPVDLNNVFIASENPAEYIRRAEADGFPRNSCGWIKGIYGVVRGDGFREVIAVAQGDCSFTQALMEVLRYRGVGVTPFSFPFDRDPRFLLLELEKMASRYGTTVRSAEEWKARLDRVRSIAHEIDRLTWQEGKVTGEENHRWLVACSDFDGDPDGYARRAQAFLDAASTRRPMEGAVPVAFVGVPPIVSGLHACFEEAGARIVLNEVQRQFSMPAPTASLVDQYLAYTYPYSFFERLSDIRTEVSRRGARGVVHYVQSFCFRQIEDILLRGEVGVPVLTLEGDQPGPVDERTRIRIQAFVEMLRS